MDLIAMRVTHTPSPETTAHGSNSAPDNGRVHRTPSPGGTRAQSHIAEPLNALRRQRSESSQSGSAAPSPKRFRAALPLDETAPSRSTSPHNPASTTSETAFGPTELIGPVMLKNVRHYPDGTSIGEIDPSDEEGKNELISFLFEVDGEDPGAIAARFEDGFPPDAFEPQNYDGLLVAVKDDLIAGFMDYSKTELHDPKHVAQINILVAQEHRGTDVARNLAKQTDDVLINHGCRYKFSRVWEGNTAQLERKQTRGWRHDPVLSASGATKAFWIALDGRFKDIPPPRLIAAPHPQAEASSR